MTAQRSAILSLLGVGVFSTLVSATVPTPAPSITMPTFATAAPTFDDMDGIDAAAEEGGMLINTDINVCTSLSVDPNFAGSDIAIVSYDALADYAGCWLFTDPDETCGDLCQFLEVDTDFDALTAIQAHVIDYCDSHGVTPCLDNLQGYATFEDGLPTAGFVFTPPSGVDIRELALLTVAPTPAPVAPPTAAPTVPPTPAPMAPPTPAPTAAPTVAPTASPTAPPTAPPTATPTAPPTAPPTTAPPTPPPQDTTTAASTPAPQQVDDSTAVGDGDGSTARAGQQSAPSSSGSNNLSAGEISGIAVGCVAAVGLVGAAVYKTKGGGGGGGGGQQDVV